MARTTRQLRLEALQGLIENSGVDFNDKNRKSWVLDCPKCGKEERLYIRRRDGRFVCWYCRDKTADGFEGAPEYALALILGRSVKDIQDIIYGPEFVHQQRIDMSFSYSAKRSVVPEEYDDREEDYFDIPEAAVLPPAMSYPPNYYPILDHRSTRGMEYLEGRGIDRRVASYYDLQYDAPRRRVVFPVVTRGVLVGWQARATGDTTWTDRETGEEHTSPKILTTMVEGMRDNVLMFEHRLEGYSHAVLTEGPVDALKCDLIGGNVCSMGKSVSDGQIARLRAYGIKRLYLGQDPDAADETSLLVKRYHEEFEMWYMTSEGTGYEDFGAMPPEVALECFKAAERVHPKRIFGYFDPDAAPKL